MEEIKALKHLRDIRFGKWALARAAIQGFGWAMHPWRHELAMWIGTGNEPEDQLIRVLDLDRASRSTSMRGA